MKISDKQLIGELRRGSLYSAQIAKKYNVSSSAISQRISKLKKKHILKETLRTSYKQYSLLSGFTKKLNKNLTSRNGRESLARSTKLRLEPHRFTIKFPLLHRLPLEKLNLFPIKKKLKNWTAYYSIDKSVKITTRNVFFYVKVDILEQDTNQAEAIAVSKATKKALFYNQKHDLRINLHSPSNRQEIRVKHPLINEIFKDHKRQVYYPDGDKKVYHGAKTAYETPSKERAERIGHNLSIISAREEIMQAIGGLVQVQSGYAVAIQEHLKLVGELRNVLHTIEERDEKFKKKVRKFIEETI